MTLILDTIIPLFLDARNNSDLQLMKSLLAQEEEEEEEEEMMVVAGRDKDVASTIDTARPEVAVTMQTLRQRGKKRRGSPIQRSSKGRKGKEAKLNIKGGASKANKGKARDAVEVPCEGITWKGKHPCSC